MAKKGEHIKITKQMLKEYLSNINLERFILNNILEDSKGYNGSFIERVKSRLSGGVKIIAEFGTKYKKDGYFYG